MERPEPAKPALRTLPVLFTREKRAKYAGLLETHKEKIARTGMLAPEIVRETEKDFGENSRRIGKISLVTAAILGGVLASPQATVSVGAAGFGIGKIAEGAWNKAKKLAVRLSLASERRKTRYLAPQELYANNMRLIEARIKQLRKK